MRLLKYVWILSFMIWTKLYFMSMIILIEISLINYIILISLRIIYKIQKQLIISFIKKSKPLIKKS